MMGMSDNLSYSNNICEMKACMDSGSTSIFNTITSSISKGISNLFSSNQNDINLAPQIAKENKKLVINNKLNDFDDVFGDLDMNDQKSFNAVNQNPNKILNPKDLFSYRGIDGNWEYSNNLLRLFGIDDTKLELLNTLLGGSHNKNVLITLVALAYIQINQNLFGAENKIMISKSKTWLKQILMAHDMDTVNNHITSAKSIIYAN